LALFLKLLLPLEKPGSHFLRVPITDAAGVPGSAGRAGSFFELGEFRPLAAISESRTGALVDEGINEGAASVPTVFLLLCRTVSVMGGGVEPARGSSSLSMFLFIQGCRGTPWVLLYDSEKVVSVALAGMLAGEVGDTTERRNSLFKAVRGPVTGG
jgi:hypothetical protein